jgi:serine/threonine protein kinase
LAQEVDNLNSQGTVKLLNFAYLSLDIKTLLGSGSYSKVYRGAFKGTPVAIKLLFTVDLNPEVIKRCSSEAQILSKISHPNVVDIFGVSVLPPSVCIVLEICQYGSLSDVIRGGITAAGNTVVHRPVLPLCMTDRMFLALGCARGLHALHSFSPNLCHRDIKSSNFLVDAQLNAKICDLELGGTALHSIDVRKEGMLCTWQAPEVMRGEEFSQAADIYSLGLVLWEIITGKIPFAEYGRETDQLMYQVLRGARPHIQHDPQCPTAYFNLITSCWDDNIASRPTSQLIVEVKSCSFCYVSHVAISNRFLIFFL